jgi:hypothetical protein
MNKIVIFNYLISRSMRILQFRVPHTFGVEFTNGYLKNLLCDVHVLRMANKKSLKVRVKMRAGSNNAILNTILTVG